MESQEEDISEANIAIFRRKADKELNESVKTLVKTQQELATQVELINQKITDQLCKSVERHEKILIGNGTDGLVTQVSKMVQIQDSVTRELWDKEKGIQVKLDRIYQRKEDWDKASRRVDKIEIKVAGITAMATAIGVYLGTIWAKVASIFTVGGN